MSSRGRDGRISSACAECRGKHLRCDGTKPVCSRCGKQQLECIYLRSRRGQRPSTVPPSNTTISLLGETAGSLELERHCDLVPNDVSLAPRHYVSQDTTSEELLSFSNGDLSHEQQQRVLNAYYAHFHATHPCALPQMHLMQRVPCPLAAGKLILMVMCYIGATHVEPQSASRLDTTIQTMLKVFEHKQDPWVVLALLLYSIATYWHGHKQQAYLLLQEASEIAIKLGMHRREYADAVDDPLLAESWRRTWWELYITQFQLAAINRTDAFMTSEKTCHATTDLPCDALDYEIGTIRKPRTLEEYDARELSMVTQQAFSSFAYLIGLVRSLDCSVLVFDSSIFESATTCLNLDSIIEAWISFQPPCSFSSPTDMHDEMLCKAWGLIYISQVETYRRLSTLHYMSVESISTCSPLPPPSVLPQKLALDADTHTKRVLEASQNLVSLFLSRRQDITSTSPFAICILASVTIVQAVACRNVLAGLAKTAMRERIRAGIGILESFSRIWPQGKVVVQEVKIIVAEALDISGSTSKVNTSTSDSSAWTPEYTIQQLSGISAMMPELSDVNLDSMLLDGTHGMNREYDCPGDLLDE